ncbi:DEKNAAC104517 [Brettanomyces naardenensis]|uniref:DEKNAAC104517 n=1 Tax=Brettanomyces naardenensis TaxID=13370 RepID=A0A448YRK1_BRENA|nr:DEKNAAC104517 [Brettanomyces naardenensis]
MADYYDSSHSSSGSESSSISVVDSTDNNSVGSSLSGDPRLNDHRHQSMSLPVRTDSKLLQAQHQHQKEYHQKETVSILQPPEWNKTYLETNEKKQKQKQLKRKHRHVRTHTHHKDKEENKGNKPASSRPQITITSPKKNIYGSPSSVTSSPVEDRLGPDGPIPQPFNPLVNSRDLRSKMLAADDDGEEDEYAVKFQDRYGPLSKSQSLPQPQGLPVRRSKSISEQVRMLVRANDDSHQSNGILLPAGSHAANESISRTASNGNGITIVDAANGIGRITSHSSSRMSRRRDSHDSNDSDADSHGSRDSQETEEDVCFPMVPKHIRVRGIDFDEIEEFITEQRQENEEILRREQELKLQGDRLSVTTSSEKFSTAALRYTPRYRRDVTRGEATESAREKQEVDGEREKEKIHRKVTNFPSSGSSSMGSDSASLSSAKDSLSSCESCKESAEVPDRFSFFNSAREETIHAPDIPSLVKPGESVRSLFEPEDSVWWLDCICPTDEEMKMLAKALGIHPLTAEDIRMQEAREKVELFRTYYFVCFHTFEPDSESEDFLEPINVYLVVFRQGILTFHFSPITNPANVRKRVRQLRDYVDVSADWLCYAMIDDITDGFAPVIHSLEYEADAIEDSVFLSRENDFRAMLFRIGESRRKVMTLMRLLQGKADVIKMFAKRCHEETPGQSPGRSVPVGPTAGAGQAAQPRADIALYLGDIQDHIITMFQSLLSYEKIFSRSHSNYLAQLQVESFYSGNQITDMLSKVTMIGTILVPMNLVTGLFGMNVQVPGGGVNNYGWWFGIMAFIILVILVLGFSANWYMNYAQSRTSQFRLAPAGMSMRTFGFGKRNKQAQRDRTNKSMVSLPSRFTRYGDWS